MALWPRFLDVYSYLPFLYSVVSFLGVIMLLICTPLGFARLFTIVGDLVVRPTISRNLDEEFNVARYEEETLKRRIDELKAGRGQGHLRMTPVVTEGGVRLRNGDVLAYYQVGMGWINRLID